MEHVNFKIAMLERVARARLAAAGILIGLWMQTASAADGLERLKYNHPGLVVDLGVGLWAWPLPMDFDGDGDLDLVVNIHLTNRHFFPRQPAELQHVHQQVVQSLR